MKSKLVELKNKLDTTEQSYDKIGRDIVQLREKYNNELENLYNTIFGTDKCTYLRINFSDKYYLVKVERFTRYEDTCCTCILVKKISEMSFHIKRIKDHFLSEMFDIGILEDDSIVFNLGKLESTGYKTITEEDFSRILKLTLE